MTLIKRLWIACKSDIVSIIDITGTSILKNHNLLTFHNDYKAIRDDWRFLVDDADILESLYQEIQNEKK